MLARNKIFCFSTVMALALMFIASAVFLPVKAENSINEIVKLANNSTTEQTSYGVDEAESVDIVRCWNYMRSFYNSNQNRVTFNNRYTYDEVLRQKKYSFHNDVMETLLYSNEDIRNNNNYFFSYTNNYTNRFIDYNGKEAELTATFDYKTQTMTLNGNLNNSYGCFAWFELGSMYDWLPRDYFGGLAIRIEKVSGTFTKGSHAESSNPTYQNHGNAFTLGLTEESYFNNSSVGSTFDAYSTFTNTQLTMFKTVFSNYGEIADIGNNPILFIYSQGGTIFDNYKFKISLSNKNDCFVSQAYNLIESIEFVDESGYDYGYQTGYSDGQKLADDFNLSSIFWEIIDAPFRLIGQALNFDFLGINFADTIKVILTLLIVVGVVKIFL